MSDGAFRRERLIDRGPRRLVVFSDPERQIDPSDAAEVFTVEREGAMKQILWGVRDASEADWLAGAFIALRDHLTGHPEVAE